MIETFHGVQLNQLSRKDNTRVISFVRLDRFVITKDNIYRKARFGEGERNPHARASEHQSPDYIIACSDVFLKSRRVNPVPREERICFYLSCVCARVRHLFGITSL